jgi:hypothetical protein
MSQPDPIPSVILVPKQGKPRHKRAGEQVPWVYVAVGGSVVFMFVVIILTIVFSMQGTPARPNEEALNALPAAQRPRPEPVEVKPAPAEKKPAPAVKGDDAEEDLGLAPIAKNEFVDCAAIGTDVKFMKEPPAAFARAREEKKMVFVMHLSGNLEDPDFT